MRAGRGGAAARAVDPPLPRDLALLRSQVQQRPRAAARSQLPRHRLRLCQPRRDRTGGKYL